MATLNQLASIVQNQVNGGVGVINERYPIEQIKDEIVFTLHRIIGEQRKQGILDASSLNILNQRLDCVEVVCKPLTECCQGVRSTEKALYAKIPTFSEIHYVGGIGYDTSFVITYGTKISVIGKGRFTKGKTIAWIRGGNELIILNPPSFDFKYLSISGIPQDFRALYDYNCASCKSDDDEVPIPVEMADMITGKLIASYLNYGQKLPVQPNTQSDLI